MRPIMLPGVHWLLPWRNASSTASWIVRIFRQNETGVAGTDPCREYCSEPGHLLPMAIVRGMGELNVSMLKRLKELEVETCALQEDVC